MHGLIRAARREGTEKSFGKGGGGQSCDAPVRSERRKAHPQTDQRPQPNPFERERREVVAPENGGVPRPLQRASVQRPERIAPVRPEAIEKVESGVEQRAPLRRKIAEGRAGLQADMQARGRGAISA